MRFSYKVQFSGQLIGRSVKEGEMSNCKNGVKTMIWCILLMPTVGCQAQELRSPVATKGLQQQHAAYVHINGGKFRLLQRHRSYWLLTDLQNFQQVHLTNQLVVSGISSADELRKRLKISPAFTIKTVTDGVLSVNGTIAELMQLEPQLKQIAGVHTEWQLFYLPLKTKPDR